MQFNQSHHVRAPKENASTLYSRVGAKMTRQPSIGDPRSLFQQPTTKAITIHTSIIHEKLYNAARPARNQISNQIPGYIIKVWISNSSPPPCFLSRNLFTKRWCFEIIGRLLKFILRRRDSVNFFFFFVVAVAKVV